jgi:hypothetical protein
MKFAAVRADAVAPDWIVATHAQRHIDKGIHFPAVMARDADDPGSPRSRVGNDNATVEIILAKDVVMTSYDFPLGSGG